jgi:hypothetical protein
VQTEKRKNRPIEDSLDEEVNLEDLHRDDYDEEDFGYEEDYPFPEKRKNQLVGARYHYLSCRARRLLSIVLGLTLFLVISGLVTVRTIDTSGVSQNVREIAGSMGQNMAHDLSSSLVPVIVNVVPFLVMLFGVVIVVRVMRRRFRD